MQRIPEPELMEELEQAKAYAEGDFEQPHSHFITLFQEAFPNLNPTGYVLDLGCGPGDITFRFARAYPQCRIHGIDGARAMLQFGLDRLSREPEMAERIELIQGLLPRDRPPRSQYHAVISNSILHHLENPDVLWQTINQYAGPGAPIFIMDLRRPETDEVAKNMVRQHAADEPEVLQRDFYYSLLASYETAEISQQLHRAGLEFLKIQEIGDRHVTVSGFMR